MKIPMSILVHVARIGVILAALAVLVQDRPVAQETATPDPAYSEMLIKNSIIALNQANLTGNYSVLRELGTPAFQTKNSTARLSDSFAKLRQQRLDLSGIVLLKPNVTEAKRQKDVLSLKGFFPSNPLRVGFHVVYARYGGKMRLHGIAVSAVPAATAARDGESGPSDRADIAKPKP